MLYTIFRNELRRIWNHPLVWITLSVSLLILGFLFLVLLNNFYEEIQVKYASLDRAPGLTDTVVSPLLLWSGLIACIFMPLLSMRSISEEYTQGSFTLLASAPVNASTIVLGKAMALFIVLLAYLTYVLLMPASLISFVELDWGKIAAGSLAILLFAFSFTAISIWTAAFTRSLALGVIASYGVLLILFVFYISGSSQNSDSSLFVYLSNFPHFTQMLTGIITSRDVVYFLLITVLFLSLASLQLRRN